MRILVLPSHYPNAEDPINAVFVRDEVGAIARHADVLVLALALVPPRSWAKSFRSVVERGNEDGVAVVRIRLPQVPVLRWPLHVLAGLVAGLIAVRSFRPHVLHAHAVIPGGVLAWLLGALTRRPFVLTEYTNPFSGSLKTALHRVVARRVVAAANAVVVRSEFSRRQIEAARMSGRFVSVPNTVDAELFHPGAERRSGVLYVGRLAPEKRVETLLRALGTARAGGAAELRLTIAGDGPERPRLEQLARTLGLESAVAFHGLLGRREVAELMRRAAFLALPSETENQPCVLLEAMTAGLPVVASAVGGVPELVPPGVGILVDDAGERAWSAALLTMADKAGGLDREALAAGARARFSYEAVGARMHALYEEIAAS